MNLLGMTSLVFLCLFAHHSLHELQSNMNSALWKGRLLQILNYYLAVMGGLNINWNMAI